MKGLTTLVATIKDYDHKLQRLSIQSPKEKFKDFERSRHYRTFRIETFIRL